ncbi:MAG: hypothetical protein V4723_21135 [Pseudomonadota bacterium]
MSASVLRHGLLAGLLLGAHGATLADGKLGDTHAFGIIGHSFARSGGEERLTKSLARTRSASLEFVVATGIKEGAEPCTDAVYSKRRKLLDGARRPLIVIPAASDWSECRNGGRRAGLERLNRLRELLYEEAESLGERKMGLSRLSMSSQFRSYAENAYWVVDSVMYATVNIPADNNLYRPEAGRNSEFEDRSVANRYWIKRLFALARGKKLDALVLFSEGDVKILSEPPKWLARLGRGPTGQDGYVQLRHQIQGLAQKFAGKVLLVDTAPVAANGLPTIAWKGNLGHVSVGSGVYEMKVAPKAAEMFALEEP